MDKNSLIRIKWNATTKPQDELELGQSLGMIDLQAYLLVETKGRYLNRKKA